MHSQIPVRDPETHVRRLRRHTLLIRGDNVFKINASAERIWSMCDGSTDVATLVARLGESVPALSRRELADQCAELLRQLNEIGAITWRDPAPVTETA